MIMQMNKGKQTSLVLVLCLIAFFYLPFGTCEPPENQVVLLNTPTIISDQSKQTYKYFQATIDNPLAVVGDILLITASSQANNLIRIFVTTSASDSFDPEVWPSEATEGVQKCSYWSIDTCAMVIPSPPENQESLTIYFTVFVGSESTYTLEIETTTLYDIKAGHKYSVNLNNAESAMLRLPGSQFSYLSSDNTTEYYDQITFLCIYSSFQNIGQFQLVGSLDALITSGEEKKTYEASSFNAFSKILILPSPQEDLTSNQSLEDSNYYILLEGENGTSFNFTVYGSSLSEHQLEDSNGSYYEYQLEMNSTIGNLIEYEVSSQKGTKNIVYSYSQPFPEYFDSIYIDLYALRGWGKFLVNYCDSLYVQGFENVNGENGEVIVTPDMRKQCLGKQKGLLLQNLQINIIDVYFQFGYMIFFNEGVSEEEELIYTGLKQFGALDTVDNTKKSYTLGVWHVMDEALNSNTFVLKAKTLEGTLIYTISECWGDKIDNNNSNNNNTCTVLNQQKLGQNDKISNMEFSVSDQDNTTTLQYILTIQIPAQQVEKQNSTITYNKYSVLLTHYQTDFQLTYTSPSINDIVQQNQYNFYYINVSALRSPPLADQINFNSNATILKIRNTVINGQCITFVSAVDPYPNLDTFFDLSSDTWIAFNGEYQYVVNSTYPNESIYIGVLGDAESIYHLQFVLDTDANVPARYLSLSENAQNDFIISEDTPYVLLKYASHIIPYSIVFSPEPSCISFGSSLPLSDSSPCNNADLPQKFTDPVIYFNVSQLQLKSAFKFSVYVNSGNYLLSEDKPLLIGCDTSCYETVVVNIEKGSTEAKIMHSGTGSISLLPGNTQTTKNDVLTLECPAPPCSYTLNASISSYFGGSMEVSYISSWAGRIQWRTKTMLLPQQINQSTHLYQKIDELEWDNPFDHSYTFYTEGVDLTILYSLLVMDENNKNTMEYIFPSLSYNQNGTYSITTQQPQESEYSGHIDTYVSEGNPLSPTHIVTIPKQLLIQNNCYQYSFFMNNNNICIVTFSLYINPNVQYSNQYIRTGFGYYSSNTIFVNEYDNVELNYPMGMQQIYGISNYQYSLLEQQQWEGGSYYTIHVKPISNCRPVIQIENNQYETNHYLDVTLPDLMPGQQFINYRIVTNDNCMFKTMLTRQEDSTTQATYEALFSDILYEDVELSSEEDNGMYYKNFIYTHLHSFWDDDTAQSFYIDTTDKVSLIQVCYYDNSDQCPYTVNNFSRIIVYPPSTNTTSWEQKTTYIIKIANTDPNVRPSVIAHSSNEPITILHNQQHVYTYAPYDNSLAADNNETVVYRYHTLSNILLFVEINRCKVRLVVYNQDEIWRTQDKSDAIVLSTILTNTSEPWVVVNDDGEGDDGSIYDSMQNYLIEFTFLTDESPLQAGQSATLRLHIEEDGTLGLSNLYMGINKYDAFVHNNAMNCYQYSSPMLLGQGNLHVDLHFGGLLTTEEQQKQIELEIEEYKVLKDNIKVLISAEGDRLDGGRTKQMNQKSVMISPQTLRTTVDFYSNTLYKVCFTLMTTPPTNMKKELGNILKGSQYSVIVNMPSMPMLYKNQYLYNSNIQDNLQFISSPYQMFEYINYDNDPLYQEELTIMVTNCVGRVNLLASSSYKDMQTGLMTQIKNEDIWKNNGIIVGLVDILYGYYYIGISHAIKDTENIYKLEVNTAVLTQARVPIIAESFFTINWAIKAKAYPLFEGEEQFVAISIPTVVRAPTTNQTLPDYISVLNVERVQYQLYLMNLEDPAVKKLKHRIDSYARCPHLLSLESSSLTKSAFKPSQIRNVTDFQDSNPSTIQFKLPIEIYKPFANISIKAKVYIKSQLPEESPPEYSYRVLTYYYGSDEIQIVEGNSSGSVTKPFKWILMVAVVFGAAAFLAVMVRKCVAIRRNRVNFEMTDYGNPEGREMEARNTNRRPINNNTGYGEFVDESLA